MQEARHPRERVAGQEPQGKVSEMKSTYKRWAGATAAVALVVSGGCAVDESSTPDTSSSAVAQQAERATPPGRFSDEVMGAAMKSALDGEGITLPDGMYLEYARITCESIGRGVTPMAVATIAYEEIPRFTMLEHASIVGASIGAMCPEHGSKIGGL